jgi:diaminopimelate epimerase
MNLIKAHALGNDFLLVNESALAGTADVGGVARAVCARHRGIGADGLLIYASGGTNRATMRLLNADGSPSEISGNGLRCLAALMAELGAEGEIEVDTDAGRKHLALLDRHANRYTFRAAMGHPERVRQERITAGSAAVDVVTLRVGNPQCVVLGEVTEQRLHTLAAALAVHEHFPEGTNVELASLDSPDRVRILIWERGVGPTEASGTGACAAAVAAMSYAGAARDIQVVSPGGTQRVEWTSDGLFLTGWAEVVADVHWRGELPA